MMANPKFLNPSVGYLFEPIDTVDNIDQSKYFEIMTPFTLLAASKVVSNNVFLQEIFRDVINISGVSFWEVYVISLAIRDDHFISIPKHWHLRYGQLTLLAILTFY